MDPASALAVVNAVAWPVVKLGGLGAAYIGPMMGFTASGVVKGSLAAAAQSAIPNVAAGSVFAGMQSAAATGVGVVYAKTALVVVNTVGWPVMKLGGLGASYIGPVMGFTKAGVLKGSLAAAAQSATIGAVAAGSVFAGMQYAAAIAAATGVGILSKKTYAETALVVVNTVGWPVVKLGGLGASYIGPILGFTKAGVLKGSLASAAQSAIGNVSAGSVFAGMQSATATSTAGIVFPTVSITVAAAYAAYKSGAAGYVGRKVSGFVKYGMF